MLNARLQNVLQSMRQTFAETLRQVKLSYCLIAVLGSGILAFGLYHVHSLSGVTEGGILGLTLLLEYWLSISPAVSGFILNTLCYLLGWKLLGHVFIFYSMIASTGFSIIYKICEQFDPLWPWLADMPLVAALVGAMFVGVGVGLCVRIGGAPGGDDAIAMVGAYVFHTNVERVYLISDLVVLVMALSYIPVRRIGYSLLTVLLSGQIIGLMQKIPLPKAEKQCAD